MTDLTEPLTPAGCNLQDFPFMPLDVVRLRDSDLAIQVTGEEFRCAVLLWCASWHQVPAASLPDDDRTLASLAGFGRAVSEWTKHREGALRGWIKCSDGRLYHPVVAEKAMEALKAKLEQRWKTECARIKKHNQRHGTDLQIHDLDTWMSLGCPQGQALPVPGTNPLGPRDGQGHEQGQESNVPRNYRDCPDSVPRETHSKGQGEGQGQLKEKEEAAAAPPPRACVREASPAAPPNALEIPADPPGPPAAIPDEAPKRATQIVVLLRRNGADPRIVPNDRHIAGWVRDGVTDAQVLLALETAKERRKAQGSDQPIGTAYLAPIIADLRAAPPEAKAGGGRRDRYAKDAEQIQAMARWADEQLRQGNLDAQFPRIEG